MEIARELLQPLNKTGAEAEVIGKPRTTYWQDVRRRFKRNKLAMAGLFIIVVLTIMAVIGPHLTNHTYDEQNFTALNQAPNSNYWFGTDELGRDLFTRIWYGARISLQVGLLTTMMVFVIGVLYGGISGYFGGKIDEIMMRIVEILSSIPFLLWVILLMVVMEPGLKTIFIALGAVYWLNMARLVRGQVLSLKEQEYVYAARVLGASPLRILVRHIIPNTLGPIIVAMTLMIPEAIFTEAWLSFLGLGVSAPMASWGSLASDGVGAITSYPWQLLLPAFFICITMLAFNFVGDGLRDALDPRARR